MQLYLEECGTVVEIIQYPHDVLRLNGMYSSVRIMKHVVVASEWYFGTEPREERNFKNVLSVSVPM